jgi:hypothetical protein
MTDKKVEKVYVGKRYSPLDCKVWVRIVETDQVDDYVSLKTDEFIGEYEIEPRLDLRNHPTAGLEWGYPTPDARFIRGAALYGPACMEWGYNGIGPAQTAMAIASDYWADDEKAQEAFKIVHLNIIQNLPAEDYLFTDGGHEQWRLPSKVIDSVIKLHFLSELKFVK